MNAANFLHVYPARCSTLTLREPCTKLPSDGLSVVTELWKSVSSSIGKVPLIGDFSVVESDDADRPNKPAS